MALSQKLQIKQGQSLVITPQLQQAIKLLQLSNIELNNFIEEALERNPLLEISNEDNMKADKSENSASEYGADSYSGDSQNKDDDFKSINIKDDFSKPAADSLDSSIEDIYPDARADSYNSKTEWNNNSLASSSSASGSDDYNLEAFVSEKTNLRTVLADQLSIAKLSASEKLIGSYLIDQVDDDGYLKIDLENIALTIGTDLEVVEKVLQFLKGFDPVGVMSSSLAECLKIQLKEKDHLDPIMEKLIDNLDILAKSDYEKLMKILKVDEEDLADMIDEIKSLNPKPGAQYSDGNIETIVADVFVKEAAQGGWTIELNNETLPKILVNQKYYTEVSEASTKSEEKEFISGCLQEANWLVKSLDQRARTILKVTKEIVKQQDNFFAYGVQHLKPLTLKFVAEQIEMHESTVSRRESLTQNTNISRFSDKENSNVIDFQNIMDEVGEGIILFEKDGRIIQSNKSAENLLNAGNKIINLNLFEILPASANERLEQLINYTYLKKAQNNGRIENSLEVCLKTGLAKTAEAKEGKTLDEDTVRDLIITISASKDGKDNLSAVIQDISRWKKAEKELINAKANAESESIKKSDMLARISHEIRTPLNSILGFSEVMNNEQFGPIVNDRYKEYVSDIKSSSELLLSLINNLLDLSKVEKGKFELNFISVSLRKLVRNIYSMVSMDAAEKKLLVRINIEDGLPDIVADEISLKQIVLNLLSNSIKYSEAGGQIIISGIRTDEGEIRLSVKDTGIGMNEDELKIAMEPYRRIEEHKHSSIRGTGLGLPLTKALVEANRATFSIKSEKGKGTIVSVTFPKNRVLEF